MLRWLRRWRERAERQRVVEPAEQLPDVDPLEELARILGEEDPPERSSRPTRAPSSARRRIAPSRRP